ncbi:hypothetical protein EV651_102263 [Kribbella sp. VKM Ac-2571]|nr:hypothetical protein EV651_102263 [Kribbella sp. VKM Ac-2571]
MKILMGATVGNWVPVGLGQLVSGFPVHFQLG